MFSHEGVLSAGCSVSRVFSHRSHQAVVSSRCSVIRVFSHQGVLSSRVSHCVKCYCGVLEMDFGRLETVFFCCCKVISDIKEQNTKD